MKLQSLLILLSSPRPVMNLPSDHFVTMADLCITRTDAAAELESPAAESSRKKRGGRPQGSKNRPKPQMVIIREESESSMRSLVLHLSPGCDLVEAVSGFARRNRTGLSVLSGSGTVANVTLRHPASTSASLILHGLYDILSLAGTFLYTTPSPPASSSSSAATDLILKQFPLIISLAGAEGQVVGGEVVGPLLTAGPVVLVAASFVNPSFCQIPLNDQDTAPYHGMLEEQTPKLAGVSGGAGADSCNNLISSSTASGVSDYSTGVVQYPSPFTFQLPQIRFPYRSHE